MEYLDGATKDQLYPDGPAPREELFDEATDNGSQDRAANRGEDDEGLVYWLAFRIAIGELNCFRYSQLRIVARSLPTYLPPSQG
jgi:hypothetical protein